MNRCIKCNKQTTNKAYCSSKCFASDKKRKEKIKRSLKFNMKTKPKLYNNWYEPKVYD